MPDDEAAGFADFSAFWYLRLLRQGGASLLYELNLHRGEDLAIAREEYEGMLGLTLGVRYPQERYLEIDDNLYVARYMRAAMVAGSLSAWLQASGEAWWTSRDSGAALRRSWARDRGGMHRTWLRISGMITGLAAGPASDQDPAHRRDERIRRPNITTALGPARSTSVPPRVPRTIDSPSTRPRLVPAVAPRLRSSSPPSVPMAMGGVAQHEARPYHPFEVSPQMQQRREPSHR